MTVPHRLWAVSLEGTEAVPTLRAKVLPPFFQNAPWIRRPVYSIGADNRLTHQSFQPPAMGPESFCEHSRRDFQPLLSPALCQAYSNGPRRESGSGRRPRAIVLLCFALSKFCIRLV